MKTFRWCYFAVMVVCLLQGMINGIRAYYLVLFMQALLLIASISLNFWTALSFAYLQTTDERRAVKGDVCNLRVGIYNDKPFPFTMMRVHVQAVSRKDDAELSFSLMPKSSIDFDIPMSLPYRGEFQVGMTYLEITDIFGLVHMKFDMRRLAYYKSKELLVYPRLVMLPRLRAVSGDAKHFNALNLGGAEDGESFAGARQYRAGDTSKKIHWKLSFKQRELYSKQYDIPMESRSLLFIHNIQKAQGEPSLAYADTVCECAAAVSRHFLVAGHPVTVSETGERRMSVSARALSGFQPMYDWLAMLPFDSSGSIEQCVSAAVKNKEGVQAVYIITAAVDDALCRAVNTALLSGCQAVCVLVDSNEDGDDAALPAGAREIRISSGQDVAEVLGGAL